LYLVSEVHLDIPPILPKIKEYENDCLPLPTYPFKSPRPLDYFWRGFKGEYGLEVKQQKENQNLLEKQGGFFVLRTELKNITREGR